MTATVRVREPWERFDDDIHLAMTVRRLCEERWRAQSVASPHKPAAWVVKGNSDGYRYIDLWYPPEPEHHGYFDYDPDDDD